MARILLFLLITSTSIQSANAQGCILGHQASHELVGAFLVHYHIPYADETGWICNAKENACIYVDKNSNTVTKLKISAIKPDVDRFIFNLPTLDVELMLSFKKGKKVLKDLYGAVPKSAIQEAKKGGELKIDMGIPQDLKLSAKAFYKWNSGDFLFQRIEIETLPGFEVLRSCTQYAKHLIVEDYLQQETTWMSSLIKTAPMPHYIDVANACFLRELNTTYELPWIGIGGFSAQTQVICIYTQDKVDPKLVSGKISFRSEKHGISGTVPFDYDSKLTSAHGNGIKLVISDYKRKYDDLQYQVSLNPLPEWKDLNIVVLSSNLISHSPPIKEYLKGGIKEVKKENPLLKGISMSNFTLKDQTYRRHSSSDTRYILNNRRYGTYLFKQKQTIRFVISYEKAVTDPAFKVEWVGKRCGENIRGNYRMDKDNQHYINTADAHGFIIDLEIPASARCEYNLDFNYGVNTMPDSDNEYKVWIYETEGSTDPAISIDENLIESDEMRKLKAQQNKIKLAQSFSNGEAQQKIIGDLEDIRDNIMHAHNVLEESAKYTLNTGKLTSSSAMHQFGKWQWNKLQNALEYMDRAYNKYIKDLRPYLEKFGGGTIGKGYLIDAEAAIKRLYYYAKASRDAYAKISANSIVTEEQYANAMLVSANYSKQFNSELSSKFYQISKSVDAFIQHVAK